MDDQKIIMEKLKKMREEFEEVQKIKKKVFFEEAKKIKEEQSKVYDRIKVNMQEYKIFLGCGGNGTWWEYNFGVGDWKGPRKDRFGLYEFEGYKIEKEKKVDIEVEGGIIKIDKWDKEYYYFI